MDLFVKKSLEYKKKQEHELHRHMNWPHLTAIGIGAIIGAGIFVITGQATAQYAGPSIILSFLIAGIICIFTGLCLAELSSIIPSYSGHYDHSYVLLGELPAWIVGWTSSLQLIGSAAAVASGWSGYFASIWEDFGFSIPSQLLKAPFVYGMSGWDFSGAIVNIPAMGITAFICLLLAVGTRMTIHFNNVMVFIKVGVLILFILVGIPHIRLENWYPFIPENTGHFGEFGWSGMLKGAGVIFFAYIGFDTVGAMGHDALESEKSVAKGILSSIGIVMVVYILTAIVLTGTTSYTQLNSSAPMNVVLSNLGPKFFWLKFVISLAILAALTSVILTQLLGQSRVFYSIGKDGLLSHRFAKLHSSRKTPLFAIGITAIISILLAGLFPMEILGELVSVTTLFLLAIACLAVWIFRYKHPDYERGFRVPFLPCVAFLGIASCLVQICFLSLTSSMELAAWLLLGLLIYFTYGLKHSKIRKQKNH